MKSNKSSRSEIDYDKTRIYIMSKFFIFYDHKQNRKKKLKS